jgi:hypothetical protein
MALVRTWRRWRNFLRWKKATTPILLNTDTGELIPFASYTALPTGKWMLRRPLTLPGSPVPLFLEASLVPGGLTGPKSAKASNPLGYQVGLQHNIIGAQLPHPTPQQSI